MHIWEDNRVNNFVRFTILPKELIINHIKISKKGQPYISFKLANSWMVYIAKEKQLQAFFNLIKNSVGDKIKIDYDIFQQEIIAPKYDELKMIKSISLLLNKMKYPLIVNCKNYHDQLFIFKIIDEKTEEIPFWEQRKIVYNGLSDLSLSFTENIENYSPIWIALLDTISFENNNNKDILAFRLIIRSRGAVGQKLLIVYLDCRIEKENIEFLLSNFFEIEREDNMERKFKDVIIEILDLYKIKKEVFVKANIETIDRNTALMWMKANIEKIVKIKRVYILDDIKKSLFIGFNKYYQMVPNKLSLGKALGYIGTSREIKALNEKISRRLQLEAFEILDKAL